MADEAFLMNRSNKIIWAGHYSSNDDILLVGEGDFSFALSLAESFGSASNIVATCPESYDDLVKMYKRAKFNLERLESLGAKLLLYHVRAQTMHDHASLSCWKFNRIVFNFPHAGFSAKGERDPGVIREHQDLVSVFFRNAQDLLVPEGQVHVSHKNVYPYNKWSIIELGRRQDLIFIGREVFDREDYPGYINKQGDGPEADNSFCYRNSFTSKFLYYPSTSNHKKSPLQKPNATLVINPYPGRRQKQPKGIVKNCGCFDIRRQVKAWGKDHHPGVGPEAIVTKNPAPAFRFF